MRVTFKWYDEDKSIAYLHYAQGWTHQDVFRAFSETFDMLESVNHSVDLVVEVYDQNVPANIISITSVLKSKISINQRHTYFVNANTFIRILIRASAAAIPAFERVTFCDTFDEALKRLHRDREQLAAHAALAYHRSSRHESD